MPSVPTYRFTLTIDAVSTVVNPSYNDSLSKVWELQQDEMFFRQKLDGDLIFQRSDYTLINAADLEDEIELLIEVSTNNGQTYSNFWTGYFYRVDCDIDEDNNTIRVTPLPKDKYDKVLGGLDKEFNLVDIAERTKCRIRRAPVFQIYIAGATYVNNYLNGTYWEQQVVPEDDNATLLGYEFTNSYNFVYITGNGTLSPDVSGIYTPTAANEWTRLDGNYILEEQPVSPDTQWGIRESGGAFVYDGVLNEAAFNTLSPFLPGTTFSSASSSDECVAFEFKVYSRVLTNVQSLFGSPTVDIPSPDLVGDVFNYSKVSVLPITSANLYAADTNSTAATRYGKIDSGAINFAGNYFTRPAGVGTIYPLSRSEWNQCSVWFEFDSILETAQETAGEVIIIRDAYKLPDVISGLLDAMGVTDVTHQENNNHSNFFYALSTPSVRGSGEMPVLIPKSNVILGDYDKPASKAPIKLSDVLRMLRDVYNVYWYIDSEDRLTLEHVLYFTRGTNYDGDTVGFDATTLFEPKTALSWAFSTKQYTFDKSSIPERMEWDWMDDVTAPFEGYPLVVQSTFAEKGNIDKRNIALFTPDIDFIQVQPGQISRDGFALIDSVDDGFGVLEAPYATVNFDGETYKLQNAYLSLIYIHEQYWKYNAPASRLQVNERGTTATTVRRTRIQELTLPGNTEPDPLTLVRTALGVGRFRSLALSLSTRELTTQIEHDTE